jgi:hypothetical protein
MGDTADHTVLIALLATGAAILAALIAAVSADMRQRRQLKHSRELQDLTELRSVLDEAAVAFDEAFHHLTWAIVGFDRIEGVDAEAKDDEVEKEANRIYERMRQEQYNKDMQKCSDARDRMILAGRRIAIRLGGDEPLLGTYQGAIDLVIDCIRDIHAKKREQDAGARVSSQNFGDWVEKFRGPRKLFVTQAVARVGSHLP